MPVLVAVNGSCQSEAPLLVASEVAQRIGEALTILTVTKPAEARVSSDRTLAGVRRLLPQGTVEVWIKWRVGDPGTEIVREAEEGSYELVVVGAPQTRNLLVRLVHGSTAIRVGEHAPCPVIVAKGKIGPIRRLLLCDSGSEDPSLGLSTNLHDTKRGNSTGQRMPATDRGGPSLVSRFTELPLDLFSGAIEIVVLHVMSQISAGPGVRGQQLRSDADQLTSQRAPEGCLLGRDIEVLQRLGLNARAKVCHGLVVEEILKEAQAGDHDLVVNGADRGAGWQRILLDDLAHRIVVELDRPVLVLR